MQPHTIRLEDMWAAADWLMRLAYGRVLLPLSTEGHVGLLSLGKLGLCLGLNWVTWFFCSVDAEERRTRTERFFARFLPELDVNPVGVVMAMSQVLTWLLCALLFLLLLCVLGGAGGALAVEAGLRAYPYPGCLDPRIGPGIKLVYAYWLSWEGAKLTAALFGLYLGVLRLLGEQK